METDMNMISTLRQRIKQNGKAEITAKEYDQLQAEWIMRTGAEEMVLAEREACAKLCEALPLEMEEHKYPGNDERCLTAIAEAGCRGAFADAIRMRSNAI